LKLLWKPLLAALLPVTADLDALPYPLWGSPKIDGFRIMGQNNQGVSRKGTVYRNSTVQEMFASGKLEGLDGEIVVGSPWASDVFNRTQNCVNSGSKEAAWEFFKHGAFHVFGAYGAFPTISSMYSGLNVWRNHGQLRIVPQTLIKNRKQLEAFEAKCLAKGYEGVMLRRADGPAYPQKPGKDNRSTVNEFYLVKLKRFDYGEARIIAPRYLEHNKNEERTSTGKRSSKKSGMVVDFKRIGKVDVVEIDTKAKFSLTVPTNLLRDKGFDWWQRQVGKVVRYKHQLAGAKDAPRICTCKFEELL
jgi:DNA ligase-1